MDSSDIQTDVELKLRLAGIKVLTEAESFEQPGSPYLLINATVGLSSTRELAYYAIACEVHQDVTLVRDAHIQTAAVTWFADKAGIVGTLNAQTVRGSIKDLVDEFINAYLSVNPKK